MLHAERLKDGTTLRHVGAVISDVDWRLCVAIRTCGLDFSPLFAVDVLVFKLNLLSVEQEADHLSASLYWEVDKLGHPCFFVAFFFN